MSAFFSYLLAHAYGWSAKLLYVAIILIIWQNYVQPYATSLKIMMLWFENQTVFRVFSYADMQFIYQIFMVFMTFKIISWIVHPTAHDTSSATNDKK